jgi:hypothetical protein
MARRMLVFLISNIVRQFLLFGLTCGTQKKRPQTTTALDEILVRGARSRNPDLWNAS